MWKVLFCLVLLVFDGCFSASIDTGGYNNTNSNGQHLSRKKRFLLFPVNANFLFTVSGAKSMIFKGPGGHFTILEIDLYHPLPDYRLRLTQLRLGEIAIIPTPPPKPSPPPPPPPPPPAPPTTTAAPAPPPAPVKDDHESHDEDALSPMEFAEYLKTHPDTYIPPGYGKDRSDWFQPGTYNPYGNYYGQSDAYKLGYTGYGNQQYQSYQPYTSNLWSYDPQYAPQYNQPNMLRMKRSADDFPEPVEEEDRFNISHHRDWEHYYHYRERRDLYHTFEHALGDKYHFNMKSCILRAICEARSFLYPPGKSMIMDIVRIMFSVPLKDDLQDDYSAAMREQNMDCHGLYGKGCSVSILYLILFGKFVP